MKKITHYTLEVLKLKEIKRNCYEIARKTLIFSFLGGLTRSIAHRKGQTVIAYAHYDNGDIELLNY